MFCAFFTALVLGYVFNLVFVPLGNRIKIFKSLRKDEACGISKLGGLAIVLSFFISVCVVTDCRHFFSGSFVAILAGLLLAFLLGVWDDLLAPAPLKKLSAQVAVSCLLVAAGIRTEMVFLPAAANILLTVLWFVALMNAMNFLDILDGLAAGITVLCSATFLFICYQTGHLAAGMLAAALLGSNLSFLRTNIAPAKLYMGDTGSLFNGMALAIIAIRLSYATPGREIAVFVPLLILALPLSDLIFVIFMRWKARKPVTKKSRDHFALRLVDKGMPLSGVIRRMYFLNILFNAAGLLLLSLSNMFGMGLLAVAVGIWLLMAYESGQVRVPEE